MSAERAQEVMTRVDTRLLFANCTALGIQVTEDDIQLMLDVWGFRALSWDVWIGPQNRLDQFRSREFVRLPGAN
jgi:hypothetical protein